MAAGTLLVLVVFTTPLTTLANMAAGLGAWPGAQAWVLSAMNVGTAAGLLRRGAVGDYYRHRTFLAGAANRVLNPALGCQAVASVPADRAAMGSGPNNTARYVGSGIGITVVTVLLTRSGAAPGAAGLLSGWNVTIIAGAAPNALAEQRVADLQQQINAYRDLSTSLVLDEVEAAGNRR